MTPRIQCKKQCLYGVFEQSLIVMSALSICLTLGLGITGVLLSEERSHSDYGTPLVYIFLEVASGSAVVSSVIVAVTVVVVIRGTRKVEREHHRRGVEVELESGKRGDLTQEDDSDHVVPQPVQQNEELTTTKTEFQPSRPLTVGGLLIIFIIVLFGELAVLSILWAMAIAASNANTSGTNLPVYTFVLTEMLIGILAPTLIIISTLLATVLADYTTFGRVGIYSVIPYILYPVKVFKGTSHNYWVIVDTFYFGAKKDAMQTGGKARHWKSVCGKILVTVCLAVIASLVAMEAFLTFASLTVSVMVAFTSCKEANEDVYAYTFSCYSGETLQHINCTDKHNFTSRILCFKFYPISSISDYLAGSVVAALVVAFGLLELFEVTFKVFSTLLQCKPTKVWGATVVLVGITVILGSFAQVICIFKYPVRYKPQESIKTCLFGTYIMIMGLLLLKVKWLEKPEEEKQEVALVSIAPSNAREFGRKNARVTRRAKLSSDIQQPNCISGKRSEVKSASSSQQQSMPRMGSGKISDVGNASLSPEQDMPRTGPPAVQGANDHQPVGCSELVLHRGSPKLSSTQLLVVSEEEAL